MATAANGKFAEACDAIIKALSTIEPADSGYVHEEFRIFQHDVGIPKHVSHSAKTS